MNLVRALADIHLEKTFRHRKGAVFGGIRREFVQQKGDMSHRPTAHERIAAADDDPVLRAVGFEDRTDELVQQGRLRFADLAPLVGG